MRANCVNVSVVVVAAGLWGCPGYDARVVVPESIKEVNKVRANIEPTPVDILFVVDNSASMAEEQANLAASFDAFIRGVSAKTGSYRLAVITTDAGNIDVMGSRGQPDGPEMAGKVRSTYAGAPYHQNTGSDYATACRPIPELTHSCFRGPEAARRIITSDMSAADQLAAFAANVDVGTCGSGTEQGLESMLGAVRKACNAGFIRDEANLVIVFVSDEEDASPAGKDYLAELLSATGKTADQIRVGAVVGSVDGRPGFCGKVANDCGAQICGVTLPADDQALQSLLSQPVERPCGWCSLFDTADCCTALPGRGYIAFANQVEEAVRARDPDIVDNDCTGSGDGRIACLVGSVCQADFSDTLERIARDLVSSSSFDIQPGATYAPGVVVEVNGVRLVNCQAVTRGSACDFDVRDDGARVVITNTAKVPGEDDTLAIYYTVAE